MEFHVKASQVISFRILECASQQKRIHSLLKTATPWQFAEARQLIKLLDTFESMWSRAQVIEAQ